MNKVLLLLSFLFLGMVTTNAQHRECAAHDHLHQQLQDPARQAQHEQIEREIQNFIANNPNGNQNRAVITIPVVFHVIHNGDALGTGENIPDQQLLDQLDQLNLDFRAQNTDFGSVPAQFAGDAVDMEIEFCLAQVDPNGNPTSGITRTDLGVAEWTSTGAFDSGAKPSTIWDRDRYMNFWTARFGGGSSGLLGYAQFPGGAANTDGVVHAYYSVGSMANPAPSGAPFNLGRTATHEVGHYLGLYHIWGDDGTACTGSDQVADTPNQAGASSGCPGVTNNCGSDNMTMNYMDYTDDACMYMFTNGQKARTDAVLAGSRSSLTTSAAIVCAAPSPQISFVSLATATQAEGTSCGTRDITVEVQISQGASAAATVNITPSGTADAADYSISTGSVSFAAGSTTNQSFTITIEEDAVVEGDETIILDMAVSTTGDATELGGNQQLVITLTNDDVAPNSGGGTTTYINQDFTAATGWTIGSNAASTGTPWGLSTAQGDTAGNDLGAGQFALCDSDAAGNGSVTQEYLYSPAVDLTGVTGITLDFDQYFREYDQGYQETGSVEVFDGTTWQQVYSTQVTTGGFGAPDAQSIAIPDAYANANFQVRFYYDAEWDYYWLIDNVVLTGTPATTNIQVPANAYASASLGAGDDVYFYDASGNIMCRIQNTSGHDFGCTQVRVERAGTESGNTFYDYASNNLGSDIHLANKHFEVIPEFNNTSAGYTITLYFTAAEVSEWASANVDYPTIVNMYKSNGAIAASSTVEISGATQGTFGSDFTYEASFTSGFSSFAIGDGTNPLPVELLSFTGEHLGEKGNQLDWTTATEENASHFDVERSIDGVNFEFIGKVEARGNSATELNYDFLDANPKNGVNYYRLKMVDLDATFEYSNVISLKSIRGLDITMSPNPTRGNISLIFNQEIEGNTQIQLIDVAGRTVMNQEVTVEGTFEVNMEQLASGTYFIRVTNGNLTFEDKILKF